MRKRNNDYLKYWRVVRQFVKIKYNLSQADLDVILFLYSEKYFGSEKFREFNEILSWDRKRFSRLVSEGWIESFRKKENNKKALYQLSFKASRMVDMIYKKLNGEEISMNDTVNPMFKRNVSYADKVYRNMIKEMNKVTRQQPRQTPE
jgi:hypothetical protein